MAGKIGVGIRIWIVWLIWSFGWPGGANGQNRPAQFLFDHLQEKDGLGLNLVNCFLQDRDGFLWVGTFDGLNRYDGNQFIQFKHRRNDDHSLLNNTVHDLCEDRAGNIWMAVDNGIGRYDKKTGQFHNITTINTRTLGFCSNILCDRNGDIWFSSWRVGLHRYVSKTGHFDYFPFNPNDNPLTASTFISKNGLLEDPIRNAIWVTDASGLYYFDINRRQYLNHQNNPQRLPILTDHYVSALALDGDRLIFADNTDKKIVVYSLSKRQIIKTITPITQQSIRNVFDIAAIFADQQHNLWVSSWDFLAFHIAADTFQVTELIHDEARPMSIAASFFWEGWQHPDGSIWLGTVNGISRTNPQRAFYSVYDLRPLYPTITDREGITRLFEDEDGSWWLGTHLRGLLHYQPQTNQLQVYKLPDAPNEYPYGGYVAGIASLGNYVYVGANIGFSRINRTTKQVEKIPLPTGWLRSTSLRCVIGYQDQIWIGNDEGEAFSYSPATKQWRAYPIRTMSATSKTRIDKFIVDSSGNLWAHVLPDGFARFDPRQAQFTTERSIPHPDLTTNVSTQLIAGDVDQQDNVWLTTNGYGLWRYNLRTKTYQNWTETEGLAFDHCLHSVPDHYGNVWVGAYNKISVFSPRSQRFFNLTLPYNQADLSYTNQFIQLRNGHILSVMKGHLVEFYPDRLVHRSAVLPEKVLISHVSIGDTSWLNHSGLSSVQLKAGETGFAVHFAALSSESKGGYEYAYQLDGYDDWKRVGEGAYAVYTRMPGGDYTFRVKAVAPDGRETPVSSLAIHLDTNFYQTTWFRVLLLLIGLGLVVGFLRYRASQTTRFHDLQVQATRLERDKTEIQYQNLINHLNPHFLFNSLTSLNSLININPREASVFLRKLSIIYRYILQNKDKELVTLEDELTFVQNYIDLQKSRFDDALQIGVNVPAMYQSRLIVPVTIQNLLENAIKHNTIDEESPLVIRIYPEDDYLCIINTLQKKSFVETSNKQGLASLKSMYFYLSRRQIEILETDTHFIVKVPLL